jgi:apolipoprotein N-acyltransferase
LSTTALVIGGTVFAVPYFLGSVYWLFNLARFTPAGSIGALGTLAMHWTTFMIFLVGLNVVQHTLRVPLPLSAPVLWTVSEHARTYGDFYFPWVTIGYAPSGTPLLIQHADLIGVYGISWWLVFINCLVVVLIGLGTRRGIRAGVGALLLVTIAAPLAYGVWRWGKVERSLEAAPTVSIAIIQPNIPQDLKWSRAAMNRNLARLNGMVSEAERAGPSLVIAPEASVPVILSSRATHLPSGIVAGERSLFLGVVRGFGERDQGTGGGGEGRQFQWHYNSAALVAPDRTILGTHDKQYLVPITEQIPYRRVFGFLLPLMRKQFGRFLPADELHLLTLPDIDPPVRFGTMICYESLFPDLGRRMSKMGAGFLVNITNDAWFGRTSMPFQHLGFSVLRAIETRRSVVRSANTGVSAIVDPLGQVRARSGIFEEATLSGDVPLNDEETVFTRWGSVILYLCYVATAVLLALALTVQLRRRGASPAMRASLTGSAGTGGAVRMLR